MVPDQGLAEDPRRPAWRFESRPEGLPLRGRLVHQELGRIALGAGKLRIEARFVPLPRDLVIEDDGGLVPPGLSRNKAAAVRLALWRVLRHRFYPYACSAVLTHDG